MTERDRAAVDIDFAAIPGEVLVDGAGLGRKGLIGLDEVEILDLPAGLLERGPRSRDWPRAHDLRIDAGMCPRHNARERRLPALGSLARPHEHDRGSAVIDARR